MAQNEGCVYYAPADEQYFIGAVALVNSLRLTGNVGEITFFDAGLTTDQRAFLERECTIAPIEFDPAYFAVFAKPSIHRFEKNGRVAVILDVDIIVTGNCEPILELAEAGQICGFVNTDQDRWFAEWAEIFELRAPLRRQKYLNGSFLALSTSRWTPFLERWEQLCQTIQQERSKRPFLLARQDVVADPVGFPEQDAMNALLMSEVSPDCVTIFDREQSPSWADRRGVRVVDLSALRCICAGRETAYIEWTGPLKPWMPWGWSRQSYAAFMQLLPRVLLAEDVPLRLSPSEVQPWLRGTSRARAAYRLLNTGASAGYAALGLIPEQARRRIAHTLHMHLARKNGSPT